MNLKEKLTNVFNLLGLTQKAKDQTLTQEEWKSIVDRFEKEYQVTLQTAMAEDNQPAQQPSISQQEIDAAYTLINGIVNNATEGEDTTAQQTSTTTAPTMQDVLDRLGVVAESVNQMANRAAADKPVATVKPTGAVATEGTADRTKFLFGINNEAFSMNLRWNQIAMNPAISALSEASEEEAASFRKSVVAYGKSLMNRYGELHKLNLLGNPAKLAAGDYSTNLDGVTTLPGGDEYMVRRQDALIARVLAKRDVTVFFPVRYGIQDTDVIFNAFFSEVSQAYQEGPVFKGSADIENERGYVDDAMIKLKFGPMKELERIYIGYLNKEGSDPIKWSMVEFFILNSLSTAQTEQNKRRIRGIYMKPEQGVPGPYMHSSTGIIYTLIRYAHENKLLMNDDAAYRSYTSTDMLDAVQEFNNDIVAQATEDTDLDNMCIYLNKNHMPWYLANVRTKYGKDIDFSGPNSYKNVIPDTERRIIWVPYMGQLPLMFVQEPGNLQFLENLPGEMMNFKVKDDMELVKGWSVWKEGCSAAFVGRNFATAEAMKANNFEWQQIFMNKPCIQLAKEATTCDAKKGFWFETQDNSGGSLKITDITDAKKGVAYIIECGNTTNKQTIDKSGKFEGITGEWTPTSVGDYIMVALNSKDHFVELERCVGGTRTINKALQPNIPGAR